MMPSIRNIDGWRFALLALACTLPLAARAQVDAGALQRQQNPTPGQNAGRADETTRPAEAPLAVQPAPAQASGAAVVGSGEKLFVRRFTLATPSPLITESALNAELQEFIGHDNTLADLDRATARIASRLTAQGFPLARVRVPAQEVVDGTVQLDIATGRLAAVHANGLSRLSEARARGMVDAAVDNEQGLNLAQVERGLLLLNDLPGVRGTGLVVPGSEPGTLELSLNLREDRLAGGWLSLDNYGSRSTGRGRVAGDFRLNDPSGRGDAAEAYAAFSDDTRSVTLSYALPLGYSGARLRLAGSYMRYSLEEGFQALQGRGHSNWVSAGVSYPLLRSRGANLALNATLEHKGLEDGALGQSISDRESWAASVGARGTHAFDGGRQNLDYSVTFTGGRLDRDDNPVDRLLDDLTRRTNGHYGIVRLSGGWQHNVSTRLSLAASTELQFASSNLDSSEKMYLGGPRGVRAFPIEEAGSDSGQTVMLEGRWFLGQFPQWGGQAWTAFGFVDAGHARRNHETWAGWNASNPDLQNSYWLKGVGAGTRVQFGRRTQVELVGSRRLGSNPGADLNGLDADGHSSKTRFWLVGSMSF